MRLSLRAGPFLSKGVGGGIGMLYLIQKGEYVSCLSGNATEVSVLTRLPG